MSLEYNVQNFVLPDKPSELLTLALHDLELVEKDNRYIIDMTYWHGNNHKTSHCRVCLAGSILAKTAQISVDKCISVYDLFYRDSLKFQAISFFAKGEVLLALNTMNIVNSDTILNNRKIPEYRDDNIAFKKAIRELIHDLKKEGL